MIGVEMATRTNSRVGVPMTGRERAQHEAKLAHVRAEEKKAIAEKAKAAGMKRRQVRAPDGTVQDVWSFSHSYQAMGFQDHQIHAAERFSRDWEAAYCGLRGHGFEPGVDGGRTSHGVHVSRVTAQTRLAACREYVGGKSWEIVVAVVAHGATIEALRRVSARHHLAIKADVETAFDNLDAFYSKDRKKDRTWEAIEKFNSERAEMIAQAEREVG